MMMKSVEKDLPDRRLLALSNGSDSQTTGKLIASLGRRLEPRFGNIDVRFKAFPKGIAAKVRLLLVSAVQDARAAAQSDLLIVHSALSLSLPAIISAAIFRTPVIAFIWDIYPQGSRRPESLIQKLAWMIFWCTEHIAFLLTTRAFVPSADYLPHVPISTRNKVGVWPLWLTEPIKEHERHLNQRVIKVAFAGQINQLRGLEEAVRLLANALPMPTELHLFSRDPAPDGFNEHLQNFPDFAIVHRGFLQTDDFQAALSTLDFGLISLDTEFDSPAFPSKVMSYTAVGLPILYTGPPELAELKHTIQGNGLGFVIDDKSAYSETDIAQLVAAYPLTRKKYLQAHEEKQVKLAASI